MPGGALLPFGHRWQAILASYGACVLLALLPDLSGLWPVSAFGTLAMIFALGAAVYAGVDELVSPAASPPPPPTPLPPPRTAGCRWAAWARWTATTTT